MGESWRHRTGGHPAAADVACEPGFFLRQTPRVSAGYGHRRVTGEQSAQPQPSWGSPLPHAPGEPGNEETGKKCRCRRRWRAAQRRARRRRARAGRPGEAGGGCGGPCGRRARLRGLRTAAVRPRPAHTLRPQTQIVSCQEPGGRAISIALEKTAHRRVPRRETRRSGQWAESAGTSGRGGPAGAGRAARGGRGPSGSMEKA